MDRSKLHCAMQMLRTSLKKVIVKGLRTVELAVINLDKGKFNLLVEGTNLAAVMGTEGMDGRSTKSNHVIEAEHTLGIEAARKCIIDEIQYTMASHGVTIDIRHMMLLADTMTYKGEVLGTTRFGIAKMRDSVLMLASFERTTDHLFDAAIHGRTHEIEEVSVLCLSGLVCSNRTNDHQLHVSKFIVLIDRKQQHSPWKDTQGVLIRRCFRFCSEINLKDYEVNMAME